MGILEDTLLPKFPVPEDAFMWGTVTQASPLRVKLDGETAALTVTPVDLVGGLALNDRVWVQLHGHRLVVVGKPGGAIDYPTLSVGTVNQYAGNTTNVHCDGTLAVQAWPNGARLITVNVVLERVTASGTVGVSSWYGLGDCLPSSHAPSTRVTDYRIYGNAWMHDGNGGNTHAVGAVIESQDISVKMTLPATDTTWSVGGFITIHRVLYDPPPA